MALKQKITKAVFDALSKDIQAEYKLDGDDYVLDIEGIEDTGALRRARDREVENAKTLKAETVALQKQIDEIKAANTGDALADARKKGDIAVLEKSWSDKQAAAEALLNGVIGKKDAYIQSQLVDSVASALAAKLSTAPAVILPHVKARLVADLTGETPTTRILDRDGKPSAMSLADLEKEFVTNPDFAGIIIASNGSGGGAPGGKQNNSGNAKKFAEMTGTERVAYKQRDPAGFEREAAAARAAGPSI